MIIWFSMRSSSSISSLTVSMTAAFCFHWGALTPFFLPAAPGGVVPAIAASADAVELVGCREDG